MFELILILVILGWSCFGAWKAFRRFVGSRGRDTWLETEATIVSGEVETLVAASARTPAKAPVFAFSYRVDGEYYSGRFSVVPSVLSYDAVIKSVKDRVIRVHYDPANPSSYYVMPAQIKEGDVHQESDVFNVFAPR